MPAPMMTVDCVSSGFVKVENTLLASGIPVEENDMTKMSCFALNENRK